MKKRFVLFLILVIILNMFPSILIADTEKSLPSIEFLKEQEKSLKEYDKMIKGLEIEMKELEKLNKVSPDYYGGCYLNDDGKLVINLVDDSKVKKEKYRDLTGNENIIIKKVDYSENDIVTMIYHVWEYEAILAEEGVDIIKVGDDLFNNKVIVGIKEINKEKIKKFEKYLQSDMIVYENAVPSKKESSTLKGGYEFHEVSDGNATISFCATRSYYIGGGVYGTQNGFVTAGHAADTIGARTILNINNDYMGTTRVTYNNQQVDAAFVFEHCNQSPFDVEKVKIVSMCDFCVF